MSDEATEREALLAILMDLDGERQAEQDAIAYEKLRAAGHGRLPRRGALEVLADTVDRSPRRDWLTSTQAEHEADRIVRALAASGYEIHRTPPASVEVEASRP